MLKNISRFMSVSFVICFLFTGISLKAASESYRGGTWEHGVSSGFVYSNYLHNSKTHYARIYNTSTGDMTCKDAVEGKWAKASEIQWPGDQVAEAGWNTCRNPQ